MANLKRQTELTAWVEIRIPRVLLDDLSRAYGSRNRALGALREALPDLIDHLLSRSPSPPSDR